MLQRYPWSLPDTRERRPLSVIRLLCHWLNGASLGVTLDRDLRWVSGLPERAGPCRARLRPKKTLRGRAR
jgi:hypothetical protein